MSTPELGEERLSFFRDLHAQHFIELAKRQDPEYQPRLIRPFESLHLVSGENPVDFLLSVANQKDPYKIQIVGSSGHGKTMFAARCIDALDVLQNESSEKSTTVCVTYEDAQYLAKKIGFIDPSLVSGSYPREAYDRSDKLFQLLHKIGYKKGRVVVAETVALNGVLGEDNRPIGMRRGGDAIWNERKKLNQTLQVKPSLFVVAIVSGETQYQAAKRRREHNNDGRPGGSVRGQEKIDMDFADLIRKILPEARWDDLIENRDTRAFLLEQLVWPWYIKTHFQLQPYQLSVLHNVHDPFIDPVDLQENEMTETRIMKEHSILNRLTKRDIQVLRELMHVSFPQKRKRN